MYSTAILGTIVVVARLRFCTDSVQILRLFYCWSHINTLQSKKLAGCWIISIQRHLYTTVYIGSFQQLLTFTFQEYQGSMHSGINVDILHFYNIRFQQHERACGCYLININQTPNSVVDCMNCASHLYSGTYYWVYYTLYIQYTLYI